MTEDEVIRSQADHIKRVGELLIKFSAELGQRAVHHDQSKWSSEEWPLYKESTPKLAHLTYGSKEYKQSLKDIEPALKHHYMANAHHPQHHERGIDGMTLIDLLEMLADWKASSERHVDGSIIKSLEINGKRFKISKQLQNILYNTVKAAEWMQ